MKIGVIGAAGKIGQMRVQNILESADADLAAVLDLELHRAVAVADGAPAYTDLDRFFSTTMDAVVISTPAHVRETFCIRAFKEGLHVLTEKPLAPTVEGARRIVEAARNAGKVLGCGFNMRYYPSFAHVKDIVMSGEIGEIDHVRVYGGHGGLGNFTHDWEYQAEFSGGGALWDVGIHMTDMVRFILGDITSVYGVTGNKVWNVPGSEDNAVAVFRNTDGIPAVYQASWIDWKGYQSAIEVYGSHGMVRGAYAPMQNLVITMDKPGGTARRVRKYYPEIMLREKLKSWKTTAIQSFGEELSDFIRMARGETGLRCADGHAGLRAVEIAAAVPESSRSGQPVFLEPLGEMTAR
ncbi:Gfo/Idh/MocA family protein [Ruegeria sediminis]|nr:Gfo/Idh/MocA family oxidoreductase [Ruegeria sediminis]